MVGPQQEHGIMLVRYSCVKLFDRVGETWGIRFWHCSMGVVVGLKSACPSTWSDQCGERNV